MLIKIFSSPTCPPCKLFKQEIEKIIQGKEFEPDNIEIDYIDTTTDEGALYMQMFGVYATPTSVFSHNGSPYTTIIGFRPKPVIEKEIRDHLVNGTNSNPFTDIVEEGEVLYYLDDEMINKNPNLVYYLSDLGNVYRYSITSNTVMRIKKEKDRNRFKLGEIRYNDTYLESVKGSEYDYE